MGIGEGRGMNTGKKGGGFLVRYGTGKRPVHLPHLDLGREGGLGGVQENTRTSEIGLQLCSPLTFPKQEQ